MESRRPGARIGGNSANSANSTLAPTMEEHPVFGLSALELARIQFGFTVSFHIIFPAITIGLASYLVVLEGLWLWKKVAVFRDLYHFLSKIFAVNFAMGVVSGLVMAYEFSTNCSYFTAFAGVVTEPIVAYEVLT